MDNAQQGKVIESFAQNQKSSSRKKYLLIAVLLISVILIGVAAALYFLWYVPGVQAQEYIEKSHTAFEGIATQVSTVKENTFLDRNTQYHRREDARDDAILDIEELDAVLGDIKEAQDTIAQLPVPQKVAVLGNTLDAYFAEGERIVSLNLADQVFYKKVIDAYGDDLDREIGAYDEMRYSGGDRTPFITQTQSVADYAQDALSRINNLEVPEGVDPFAYEIRKENLKDIKETFLKFNEYYRLFQYELIGPAVEANAERNEERNQQIKEHGQAYIAESNIAQGFKSLEQQSQELKNLYEQVNL
ncbi:MAG TPA: hypothetical protein VGA53_03850 [Candidatus Paceibacterota bacterium]